MNGVKNLLELPEAGWMTVCPLNDEPIVLIRNNNKVFCAVDGYEVSMKKCKQCQSQNSSGNFVEDTDDMELEI